MKLTNFIISFLFVFLIALSITLFFTKDKIDNDGDLKDDESVYLEVEEKYDLLKDSYDQNRFFLLFDDYILNTNNFISTFSYFKDNDLDYLIRTITPYDNPLYSDELNKYDDGFTFMNSNLEEGINDFYNKYKSILEKNNLSKELEKIFLKGISIRIIEIDALNKDMYAFLSKHKKIKYSLSKNGIYKTINLK
ncbi:MAG: hypothetical protein WDA21_04885 [Bacilli bacterium]